MAGRGADPNARGLSRNTKAKQELGNKERGEQEHRPSTVIHSKH